MQIVRQPEIKTLSEWLEIATRRLAEPSKERIRAEFEAHYTEATEAHREVGVSETDAQATALAELGDPKAAGRRLRRRHITEREAEWLKKFDDGDRKPYGVFLSFGVFCLFTLTSFRRDIIDRSPLPSLFFTLAFILLVLSPSFCFIVARRKGVKANRFLLSVQCITNFLSFVLFYQMYRAMFAREIFSQWIFFSIFVLIQFRHFWIPLRIWVKLGKTEPSWSHNPPAGAVRA